MGLDDESILSDILENKWYLTIKHEPTDNKIFIINSIIRALENEKCQLMIDTPFFGFKKLKYKWNKLYIMNDISIQ